MQLRSVNVGPKPQVWSSASGARITGDVVEHFLGGESYISRTSEEEADDEPSRLNLEWLFGLAQSGASLHRLDVSEWPELEEAATFMFDGSEDGMADDTDATYMSFVGSCYPTNSEFPARIERNTDEDDDPGVWELEKVYDASKEAECPWCGSDEERTSCALCDEGEGIISDTEFSVIALYKWVEE